MVGGVVACNGIVEAWVGTVVAGEGWVAATATGGGPTLTERLDRVAVFSTPPPNLYLAIIITVFRPLSFFSNTSNTTPLRIFDFLFDP